MRNEKNWDNLKGFLSILKHGLKTLSITNSTFSKVLFFTLPISLIFLSKPIAIKLWGSKLTWHYMLWFSFEFDTRAMLYLSFSISIFILIMGFLKRRLELSYDKAFHKIGFKNSLGEIPILLKEEVLGPKIKRITFNLCGHSIEEFQSRKENLETHFKANIENIEGSEVPGFCSMILNKAKLPKRVPFNEVKDHLTSPYEFIIGESLQGIIKANIRVLPHLLIAGATGYGKSQFFKQVIAGLMLSSKNIEFFLIDLKFGVEMRKFGDLPNVKVIKDVKEAAKILSSLNSEMDRRFKLLETDGASIIDPEKHQKNIICLCIDEASLLFSKVQKNTKNYQAIQNARYYIERISKLSRAAGIQIIAATQKIDLNSIPTQVQENFNARVSFRMNTIEGSGRIIKGSGATKIPSIPGRGIWQFGTETKVFQSPLLSSSEWKNNRELVLKKFQKPSNFSIQKSENRKIKKDDHKPKGDIKTLSPKK